jgi:hypothetical protein
MTWTRTEIEAARAQPLAPVLAAAGYKLNPLPNGAALVRNFNGLVVRQNTWFWKQENLTGNSIDFFMTVEGKTFAEAMQVLCPKPVKPPRPSYDEDENDEDEDQ